jgi:hypothetical protein
MINQQLHIEHFHNEFFKQWGGSSGYGSLPQYTVGYREFLNNFIKQKDIKKVVDFGCGDWQFSKLIDWSNVEYSGVDCIPSLIDHHNTNFGKENIKFYFLEDIDFFIENFTGDLLIVKDVLQHWLNDEIVYFLDRVTNNFTYILITNSCKQTEDWQEEPKRSRPLSCDFYPLKKYNIKKKAHIVNDEGEKEISLITK